MHSPFQPASASCKSSIVLDCGLDQAPLDPGDFHLGRKFLSVVTPWQFNIGACLCLKLDAHERGSVSHEGVVVECDRMPGDSRRYRTTIFLSPCDEPRLVELEKFARLAGLPQADSAGAREWTVA